MEGDLDHDAVHLLRVHWIVPNDFECPFAPRNVTFMTSVLGC